LNVAKEAEVHDSTYLSKIVAYGNLGQPWGLPTLWGHGRLALYKCNTNTGSSYGLQTLELDVITMSCVDDVLTGWESSVNR